MVKSLIIVEPTIVEIDKALFYLRELLKDPKLSPRRKILILEEIDSLLDDRINTSRLSL